MAEALDPARRTGPTAWNPYLAGGLAGLVAVLSVWVTGKYLGASTSFARTAAAIEEAVSPGAASRLAYYVKEGVGVDWQWMFVFGCLIGALIASLHTRTFRILAVPDTWKEKLGWGAVPRAAVAFLGGGVLMWGARLAGG
jgi:hypothetical protein